VRGPRTMNAFELITLSQGLDLGVLFQSRHDMVNRTTRFASRRQPEDIVARLKAAAKELQFSVHVKNFKVRLCCAVCCATHGSVPPKKKKKSSTIFVP